ncbi:hypothetical protein PENTCL1PPCAC_2961, partial [Pristionchus entomophagus]
LFLNLSSFSSVYHFSGSSLMRFALLICLFIFIGAAVSMVDFTNSAVYDVFDFRDVKDTPIVIPKCNSGCLIFAATLGETYVQHPERLDPYALNIIVVDNNAGINISIARLAQQRDESQKKIPLTGKGSISVINENDPDVDFFAGDFVLYVVEKARADQISYEVYDVFYVSGKTISPQSDIVTILGPYGIGIQAEPSAQSNSLTARLVGFDNALDDNKDGCPFAYKAPDSPTFPGLNIQTKPPIISLVVGKKSGLRFQVILNLIANSQLDMGFDGFYASPGWNGCSKATNGGIQIYRTRGNITNDFYTITQYNTDNEFSVTMDVLPHFDAKHQLSIEKIRNDPKPTIIYGSGPAYLQIPNTNYINVFFEGMKGDQGFLLRYSTTLIPKPTTTGPVTVASSTVTSTITTPTTSSGFRASGCVLSVILLSLFL